MLVIFPGALSSAARMRPIGRAVGGQSKSCVSAGGAEGQLIWVMWEVIHIYIYIIYNVYINIDTYT